MTVARGALAVAGAGAALAAVLPVSAAIDPGEVLRARVLGGVLTAAVAVGLGLVRGGRTALWSAIAAGLGIAGVVMIVGHVGAASQCVASYDGRPILIGREYTDITAKYVRENPGLAPRDLLLDAGGVPDRLWTASSIAACRLWTGWAGLLSLPLFAGAVCALMAARGVRLGPAAPARQVPAASGVARPAVYDAFLSYRHTEPDRTHAEQILDALEARGLRVAIDVRDFVPNQHFLSEMERCIKESRFVLCIITPRYVESDHTNEEAVISKTLDMSERTKRLVPLIFERVQLPVWLHGLVGIDFTAAARVDPTERLLALVQSKRES
jgi:hypothetical protein